MGVFSRLPSQEGGKDGVPLLKSKERGWKDPLRELGC